jgi:hypothetical protein
VDNLVWFLDAELWEVELEGAVVESGHGLHAGRGRLVCRVEAWTPALACELADWSAHQVRDVAIAELRREDREGEAANLEAVGDPGDLEAAADAIAARDSSRADVLAGHAADVVRYAREAADPAHGAGVAAYIAAHVEAGADKNAPGYDEAFVRARARQAAWLRAALGL